jgi:phenylalanyl-tRNA synthetase alpha chain
MAEKSDSRTQKILADLDKLAQKLQSDIATIKTEAEQEKLRILYTGRKSKLTEILRGIKSLNDEGKKQVGSKANVLAQQMETQLDDALTKLVNQKLGNIAQTERIDITLPGKKTELGHLHPVTSMLQFAEDIFMKMGFEVVYPYEIDNDYNNFQAVNIPENHPARDAWDTFWLEDGGIAITHTSSMQNRVLLSHKPPIRVIVPGRCFRNEATDARHEHTFFQIEGIYVDKGVTMGDMLGTLGTFFSEFFGKKVDVKFTPDFFPFVEPGGMISLTCFICDGKGCKVCKHTGWLEILGCGMIHPNVLKMGGIDPETYSGFAWGFGLERLIMLKYGIEDIRNFYSGNLKFIRQF